MNRPKLDKLSCAKPILELERRLLITKQQPFTQNGNILIVPLGEPTATDIPFLEGAILYASISYNTEKLDDESVARNYWVINVQFAARPLALDNEMFTSDVNTSILEATGNMIHASYPFKFTAVDWSVDEDFLLNPKDADYTATVLTGKFINEHDKEHGVSSVMLFLKDIKNLPAIEMIEEIKNG